MLIGKSTRRISHNLIISKYFEEENNEIQNQYFIRNIADELSVISLGFGGFFVVINPCSFDIEYSSDTFEEILDLNLVEVEKFEAKAATVFRIYDQDELPKFNYEYVKSQLETEENRIELQAAIDAVTGINNQYSMEQGSLGTSFDSIELNVDALNTANYKHIENEEYKIITEKEEADELEKEIAKRKQELELLSQELASKEQAIEEVSESLQTSDLEKEEAKETVTNNSSEESSEDESLDFDSFASELDALNDLMDPDQLFGELDSLFDEDETIDSDSDLETSNEAETELEESEEDATKSNLEETKEELKENDDVAKKNDVNLEETSKKNEK